MEWPTTFFCSVVEWSSDWLGAELTARLLGRAFVGRNIAPPFSDPFLKSDRIHAKK
jgi:hypothetical protein